MLRPEDLILGVSATGDQKQVIENFFFDKGGDPNTTEYQKQLVKLSEFCAFVSTGTRPDDAIGNPTGNRPWETLPEHQTLYKTSGVTLSCTARELQEAKETEAELEAKET